MQCEQVDDLLSLVAELEENVGRLRSIRECKRVDSWSHTLPSLREMQWMEEQQESEELCLSCHQAEGDLKAGKWKQVPAQGGRGIPCWLLLPSQGPLQNGCEAVDLKGQANDSREAALSGGVPEQCTQPGGLQVQVIKEGWL